MTPPAPTLDVEAHLLERGYTMVAGMDEVGRGALAGPVAVGVCVISALAQVPAGLRDSKLLTARARAELVPVVEQWPMAWAVGYAQASEIDAHGIVAALRLAGMRALARVGVRPQVVVLDGVHNWLSSPHQPTLDLDVGLDLDLGCQVGAPEPLLPGFDGEVIMRAKADRDCASVAAASVLAKVARDGLMAELDGKYPGYGWAVNKGYGSAAHRQAITSLGVTEQHRRSWRLVG